MEWIPSKNFSYIEFDNEMNFRNSESLYVYKPNNRGEIYYMNNEERKTVHLNVWSEMVDTIYDLQVHPRDVRGTNINNLEVRAYNITNVENGQSILMLHLDEIAKKLDRCYGAIMMSLKKGTKVRDKYLVVEQWIKASDKHMLEVGSLD